MGRASLHRKNMGQFLDIKKSLNSVTSIPYLSVLTKYEGHGFVPSSWHESDPGYVLVFDRTNGGRTEAQIPEATASDMA